MEFRTIIDIKKSALRISHHSRILMLGSCFAENIGSLLVENKFRINVNPFGILYNPASIAEVLKRLSEYSPFVEESLFMHGGLYHSPLHHSMLSGPNVKECLSKINETYQKAHNDFHSADTIIITFGTAYVFTNKETGEIVANCHKLPASRFNRYKLSVEQITSQWKLLISELRSVNPQLKFLFTVSPIRHWKDGAHDNQLSKATLLLAIDEFQKEMEDIFYFPS